MAKAIAIIPMLESKWSANSGMQMEVDMKTLPIVLCKDCVHYCVDKFAFCDLDNRPDGGNWFCASGEEKNDE